MGKVSVTVSRKPFRIGDTTVHVEQYVHGKPNRGITFINMHENENTSVKAARKVLQKRGGRLLRLISGGKRLVSFKLKRRRYVFDPNRVFTEKGIRKTLRKHSRYSKLAHNAIRAFVKAFKQTYALDKAPAIITLHNNTNGALSIKTFIRKLRRKSGKVSSVFRNVKADIDDFFYVTNRWYFAHFKNRGFNVYFTDKKILSDDGSLSVYCERKRIPYINVEAQHGHLSEQVTMMKAAWTISAVHYVARYHFRLAGDDEARNNHGNVWDGLVSTMTYYNQAVQDNPKNVATYNNRGVVWFKLGKHHKALVDYNKAIKLNPRRARIYNNRGIVLVELKKFKKALADYNKAIRLRPKVGAMYNNRGMAWAKLGKYQKALADFNKAIGLGFRSALLHNNRGIVWAKLGKYRKAQADYDRAIKIDPRDPRAYHNHGVVWKKLGNYRKARANYDRAIHLDLTYAKTYYSRGNLWFAQRKYQKALADYNKAIKYDPKLAAAYYNRGMLWDMLKKYKKAIANYNKAAQYTPKDPRIYINRGVVWQILKRLNKALADYNKAIGLDPKRTTAYLNRGMVWATLKKYSKARADFKKVCQLNKSLCGKTRQYMKRLPTP